MNRRLGLYSDGQVPLGRRERDVLDVIWTQGQADALAVHAALQAQRKISQSTVQSTLERLHRKKLLTRTKRARAYVYDAALSREALIGTLVADLVHELSSASASAAAVAGVPPAAVCGFGGGDTGTVSETTLQRLEQWIHDHRAARQAPHADSDDE